MSITVVSASRSPDGTITIRGTEFTKTTTLVYIDDVSYPFEWVSATEITLTGVNIDAAEVEVEKGGVTGHATIEDATEEEPPVPDPVPAEVEPVPGAIAPGTWPSPIDGFRAAVHGQALVGLIPVGDEKTPYPTGTQLAAGSKFWLRNGYYKSATPT